MDLATRLTFARTRAHRIAVRRGIQRLAARARLVRLSRCLAATVGDESTAACDGLQRRAAKGWAVADRLLAAEIETAKAAKEAGERQGQRMVRKDVVD